MAAKTTEERRAQAEQRLAPIISRVPELALYSKYPDAQTYVDEVNALDYKSALRLCIMLAAARNITLGDSGAITHDMLRGVAYVLGMDTGFASARTMLVAAIAGNAPKASVSSAAQQHAKRIGKQVPKAAQAQPAAAPQPQQQTTITSNGSGAAPAPEVKAEPKAEVASPVEASTHEPPAQHGPLSPAQKAFPKGNWQPASKVFGIKGVNGMVEVFGSGHSAVPKVDPDYVWDRHVLQRLVASVNENAPTHVWLYGERGGGKSTMAEQFAARLGRPFYKITFNRYSEPSEIIGQRGLNEGNTEWEDGTLLLALRCPVPPIVLLDEICYAQTDAISGPLNEIVHPLCSYHVPQTGETITFDKRTFFIAADNTNGSGDTTGRYHGARPLNRATVDRFGRFIAVQYMGRAEEVKALMARAECDKETAGKVVDLLAKLRAKCANGSLADPPSLREAIAFARDLRAALLSPEDSFMDTFVGKYPVEAQEELRLTFKAVWTEQPSVAQGGNTLP